MMRFLQPVPYHGKKTELASEIEKDISMPAWLLDALLVTGLFAAIVGLCAAAIGKFLRPKALGKGQQIMRFSRVASICGVIWCAAMIPMVLSVVIQDAVAGNWSDFLLDATLGALYSLVPLPFCLTALLTDVYNVTWDTGEITGPSKVLGFRSPIRRSQIAFSDIKRLGNTFRFGFIESIDGQRIYWTVCHVGRGEFEEYVSSRLPDRPKQNLFSRLAKF